MHSNPEIRDLTQRYVAYVSFTGNYLGNAEVFKELFGKLFGWAGQKQLFRPETVVLSAYYDDPNITLPEQLKLDVCMTVPDDEKGEGEIRTKVLPGGKYVIMRAELLGPEEYSTAWEKVVEWGAEKGLGIDLSRASYEIYLNNPEEDPEKRHIIEICLAIQ